MSDEMLEMTLNMMSPEMLRMSAKMAKDNPQLRGGMNQADMMNNPALKEMMNNPDTLK
jgi:hypothetical protein